MLAAISSAATVEEQFLCLPKNPICISSIPEMKRSTPDPFEEEEIETVPIKNPTGAPGPSRMPETIPETMPDPLPIAYPPPMPDPLPMPDPTHEPMPWGPGW